MTAASDAAHCEKREELQRLSQSLRNQLRELRIALRKTDEPLDDQASDLGLALEEELGPSGDDTEIRTAFREAQTLSRKADIELEQHTQTCSVCNKSVVS